MMDRYRRLRYRVDRTAASFDAFVSLAVIVIGTRRALGSPVTCLAGRWTQQQRRYTTPPAQRFETTSQKSRYRTQAWALGVLRRRRGHGRTTLLVIGRIW